MSTASTSRARLSRAARREQLLDAAARLLVEKGSTAVTMERVAEWAGVSKALPYSHFDNRDDVLVAVHHQVASRLGLNVLHAVERAGPTDERIAVMIAAYFDTVAELGPILRAVTAPGSRTTELADGDRRSGPRFVARLLVDHFDVPETRAAAVAPILLAALTGAVSAWGDRVASRREIEQMAVAVARTLIEGGA